MTKHYCDKCNKECNWHDMVRISVDREDIKSCRFVEIHEHYELCEECYQKMFIAKEGDGE